MQFIRAACLLLVAVAAVSAQTIVRGDIRWDLCHGFTKSNGDINSYLYAPVNECLDTGFGFYKFSCTAQGPIATIYSDKACASSVKENLPMSACYNETSGAFTGVVGMTFSCVSEIPAFVKVTDPVYNRATFSAFSDINCQTVSGTPATDSLETCIGGKTFESYGNVTIDSTPMLVVRTMTISGTTSCETTKPTVHQFRPVGNCQKGEKVGSGKVEVSYKGASSIVTPIFAVIVALFALVTLL